MTANYAVLRSPCSVCRVECRGGRLIIRAYKAVFTQGSLSDLTLDQSKVRLDKVCVNTLNRIGKPKKDGFVNRITALPDLTRYVNAAVSLHRYQVVALIPSQISHKCHNDLGKH